jgi:endonuclease YncB( thermonuclease family)
MSLAPPAPTSDTALVVRIIDGDMIELATGGKVRYISVNIPEISRTEAITKQLRLKAKNFNESLVKSCLT